MADRVLKIIVLGDSGYILFYFILLVLEKHHYYINMLIINLFLHLRVL